MKELKLKTATIVFLEEVWGELIHLDKLVDRGLVFCV